MIQDSFVDSKGNTTAPVILDPSLAQKLKPHQKEGLLFLYNCINGLTPNSGTGCILADEMGLGKTLTAISLIFTSLTQSPWSKPLITSAVVTCPSSLVDNWGAEFMSHWEGSVTNRKWIGRDRIRCIVLKEKGAKAEEKIRDFVMQSGLNRVVLVVSYEVSAAPFLFIRCIASTPTRSTAARRVCWSATRAIASRALLETRRSTVCSSFLRVAACCSPERPSKTIWR